MLIIVKHSDRVGNGLLLFLRVCVASLCLSLARDEGSQKLQRKLLESSTW